MTDKEAAQHLQSIQRILAKCLNEDKTGYAECVDDSEEIANDIGMGALKFYQALEIAVKRMNP